MSHKPRSENCEHDMQMIGDLVFECGRCGHTEFGCSHSKTSTIEVRQGRSITEKTICDICHLILEVSEPNKCEHQRTKIIKKKNDGPGPRFFSTIVCADCGSIRGYSG